MTMGIHSSGVDFKGGHQACPPPHFYLSKFLEPYIALMPILKFIYRSKILLCVCRTVKIQYDNARTFKYSIIFTLH